MFNKNALSTNFDTAKLEINYPFRLDKRTTEIITRGKQSMRLNDSCFENIIFIFQETHDLYNYSMKGVEITTAGIH